MWCYFVECQAQIMLGMVQPPQVVCTGSFIKTIFLSHFVCRFILCILNLQLCLSRFRKLSHKPCNNLNNLSHLSQTFKLICLLFKAEAACKSQQLQCSHKPLLENTQLHNQSLCLLRLLFLQPIMLHHSLVFRIPSVRDIWILLSLLCLMHSLLKFRAHLLRLLIIHHPNHLLFIILIYQLPRLSCSNNLCNRVEVLIWLNNSPDHIIINMDKPRLVQTLGFSIMAHLLSISLNPCFMWVRVMSSYYQFSFLSLIVIFYGFDWLELVIWANLQSGNRPPASGGPQFPQGQPHLPSQPTYQVFILLVFCTFRRYVWWFCRLTMKFCCFISVLSSECYTFNE